MLHHFAFGKPDEMTGAEAAFVCDELAFKDVHAVAARMRVQRIDEAGRIANQADLHAGVGIGEEILAKERAYQSAR